MALRALTADYTERTMDKGRPDVSSLWTQGESIRSVHAPVSVERRIAVCSTATRTPKRHKTTIEIDPIQFGLD